MFHMKASPPVGIWVTKFIQPDKVLSATSDFIARMSGLPTGAVAHHLIYSYCERFGTGTDLALYSG